jgi:hypothetical protein
MAEIASHQKRLTTNSHEGSHPFARMMAVDTKVSRCMLRSDLSKLATVSIDLSHFQRRAGVRFREYLGHERFGSRRRIAHLCDALA